MWVSTSRMTPQLAARERQGRNDQQPIFQHRGATFWCRANVPNFAYHQDHDQEFFFHTHTLIEHSRPPRRYLSFTGSFRHACNSYLVLRIHPHDCPSSAARTRLLKEAPRPGRKIHAHVKKNSCEANTQQNVVPFEIASMRTKPAAKSIRIKSPIQGNCCYKSQKQKVARTPFSL